MKKGHYEIKQHYLPLPDKSILETKTFYEKNKKDNYNKIKIFQYSEAQAKLYITEFFKKLEICYKEFVEYCFPTLKNEFAFYRTIPHKYMIYVK